MNSKKLGPGFSTVLNENEEIRWTGKPTFIPFAIGGLAGGFVSIMFAIFYIEFFDKVASEHGVRGYFSLGFVVLPLLFFVGTFVKKLASYNNTSYAYSTKRIMIRSGFLATGFKVIDYDKISDIEVTVNPIEALFNVGTIQFYSGRSQMNDGFTTKIYDRWEAISEPYQVFKELKKISMDIKTDLNYPNAFRPEINPGYKTKYKPEEE